MSNPAWINEEGIPFELTEYNTYQFRGPRLNESIAMRLDTREVELMQQEWRRGLYRVGYRILHFLKRKALQVKEVKETLRFEAVIRGELHIAESSGQQWHLRQGMYQFTNVQNFKLTFKKDKGCNYFVSYYSPKLLGDFGIDPGSMISPPRNMPERMLYLLQEALHQPHCGIVADIYYRKLVTELLFIHLTCGGAETPSELSDKDIAAIYEADAILAQDLSEHYSIFKLSGMAGTNSFKLKRGFRLIFKMGVFARLLYRRMERAKMLLETTSLPIKEVAFESGYSTVGGFINAFRKRFGKTPLDWRLEKCKTSKRAG